MSESGKDLWQIGEFSRLTRISVRMLRHYQDRSLLEPTWTDPFNGYRYYSADQLRPAQQIRELRDVGLPIEEMIVALQSDSVEVMFQVLNAHRDRLQLAADEAAAKLESLHRLIERTKEDAMSFEVIRQSVPAMTIVSLRKIIPDYGAEGMLWAEISPLLSQAGIGWDQIGMGGAIFHDPDYKESDCDVEIWMQVTEPVQVPPPLQCKEFPAHDAICTTAKGPYDDVIGPASDALASFAAQNNLAPGLMYNIYTVGPGVAKSPDDYVTEVCSEVLKEEENERSLA
ncbi:MerR family transcriptional regulator [Actinomycetaceae bacterium MB13-C1-2]|nr:MerR family transcriptional regulator [Actinomycetaceae bacterium MB13-C1-2]